MNNNIKDKDSYLGLKRLLAFVVAIGLWAVSMYFSYEGFAFESTTMLWFGLVLAFTVTVVELVFNTKITQLNPTLLVAGIICYVYGVYTNISGFYILQHGTLDNFWTGTNWLIPVFAGVISEVLPEALFAWGIGAFNSGDLIGNIGEIIGDKPTPPAYNNNGNLNSNNRYSQSDLFQNRSNTSYPQQSYQTQQYKKKNMGLDALPTLPRRK